MPIVIARDTHADLYDGVDMRTTRPDKLDLKFELQMVNWLGKKSSLILLGRVVNINFLQYRCFYHLFAHDCF